MLLSYLSEKERVLLEKRKFILPCSTLLYSVSSRAKVGTSVHDFLQLSSAVIKARTGSIHSFSSMVLEMIEAVLQSLIGIAESAHS